MFLYKLPDYEGGFVTKSIECNCIVTRDDAGHLLNSKPVNCVKKGMNTNFGKVVDYSKNFVILKKGSELKRLKREELNNVLLKSLDQHEAVPEDKEEMKVSGKFETIAGKVLVKSEREIIRDVLTDPDRVLRKGKIVTFIKTINGKEVEAKVEGKGIFNNTLMLKGITETNLTISKRLLFKGVAVAFKTPKVFNINQSAVSSGQSAGGGTAWNAKGGMKPNHKYLERKPAKNGDGYIYLYELPSGKKEWRDEAGKSVEGESAKGSADYQLEDFKVGDVVRQDNKLGRITETTTNMLAVNFGGEMKVINKKEHVEKVKQHQLMKEGDTIQYEGNDAKILRITGKAALINTADNKLKVINLEKQLEKYEPQSAKGGGEGRLNKYSDVYQGEAERRVGQGGADNYNISYEEQPGYKDFVSAAQKTGFGRKNDLEMVKRVETENGLRTVRWNYNPEDQNISFMVDGKEDYTMNFMGKKYKIRDITDDGYSLEDAETKERGLFLSHKDYNNDLKQQRDEERKNVIVERSGGVNGIETVREPARTFSFKPEYTEEERARFEKRGGSRPSRWTRRKDEPLQSEEEKKRLTELQSERDKKNKEVLGTKDFADFEKLHKERGFEIGANRFHASKEIEAGGRTFRIKSEFKPEKMSWQTSIDGPVKKLQLGEKRLPITDISKDKVFYHEGGDEKSITFDELKTINGKGLFEPTKESKGIISNLDPVKIYFGNDDKDVTSGSYEIVEADEIIASHKTDGTPNKDYTISDAQNRDRSTPQSIAQINKIATNPNFDFLSDSKTAQDGAPIVDEDYNVIAGNGRALGVQLHYGQMGNKNGSEKKQNLSAKDADKKIFDLMKRIMPHREDTQESAIKYAKNNLGGGRSDVLVKEGKLSADESKFVSEYANGDFAENNLSIALNNKSEKYRSDLLKNAEKYGFSRDDVEKMKQPVLVRRTNVDKKEAQRLGAISNTSQMLATEEREAAKGKATRIDDATINNLADMFTKGNHESLNQYLDEIGPDVVGELLKKKIIPENEAHLYIDPKSGKMDAGHKEKVKQILTQSVLGESSQHFEKIPEAARAGTVKSLGDIFALKGKAGDLVPHLQEAVKMLAKYEAVKDNFKSPDDFVKQAANDAFEPLKGSKEELALFDLLADPIREVTKENGKKEKKNVISDFIRKYKLSMEGDMFSGGLPPEAAFARIFKPKYQNGVNTEEAYKQQIRDAIKVGHKIPKEVLDKYPDLEREYNSQHVLKSISRKMFIFGKKVFMKSMDMAKNVLAPSKKNPAVKRWQAVESKTQTTNDKKQGGENKQELYNKFKKELEDKQSKGEINSKTKNSALYKKRVELGLQNDPSIRAVIATKTKRKPRPSDFDKSDEPLFYDEVKDVIEQLNFPIYEVQNWTDENGNPEINYWGYDKMEALKELDDSDRVEGFENREQDVNLYEHKPTFDKAKLKEFQELYETLSQDEFEEKFPDKKSVANFVEYDENRGGNVIDSRTIKPINETTEEILSDVQNKFGGKYVDVPIKFDTEGDTIEFMRLRIANHTGNYYSIGGDGDRPGLSIVIANQDPTYKRFGRSENEIPNEYHFDEDATAEEIIDFINEKIEEKKADVSSETSATNESKPQLLKTEPNAKSGADDLGSDKRAEAQTKSSEEKNKKQVPQTETENFIHPSIKEIDKELASEVVSAFNKLCEMYGVDKIKEKITIKAFSISIPGTGKSPIAFVKRMEDEGLTLYLDAGKFRNKSDFEVRIKQQIEFGFLPKVGLTPVKIIITHEFAHILQHINYDTDYINKISKEGTASEDAHLICKYAENNKMDEEACAFIIDYAGQGNEITKRILMEFYNKQKEK